jgi:hypothetical protein
VKKSLSEWRAFSSRARVEWGRWTQVASERSLDNDAAIKPAAFETNFNIPDSNAADREPQRIGVARSRKDQRLLGTLSCSAGVSPGGPSDLRAFQHCRHLEAQLVGVFRDIGARLGGPLRQVAYEIMKERFGFAAVAEKVGKGVVLLFHGEPEDSRQGRGDKEKD